MLVPFSIKYVVYGRFHRLAFLRKERVIQVLKDRVRHLYAFSSYENARMECEKITARSSPLRRVKTWIFIVFGFILWIFAGALTLISHFLDIYFKSLILYKSFQMDFNFMDRVIEALQFPFLINIVNPFIPFLEMLIVFKINFGAFGVTCVGAAMPYQLMVNLIVLGLVIIVVESDLQIFRVLTQAPLYELLVGLFTKEPYIKWSMREKGTKLNWTLAGIYNIAYTISINTMTSIFQGTDVFMSTLLFAMSTVELGDFFYDERVNSPTNACNEVPGLENCDTDIYDCAGYIFKFLIIPLTYEISEVLIPGIPKFQREFRKQFAGSGDKKPWYGITAALKYASYFSLDLWWLHASGSHVTHITNDIPYGTAGNARTLMQIQDFLKNKVKSQKSIKSRNYFRKKWGKNKNKKTHKNAHEDEDEDKDVNKSRPFLDAVIQSKPPVYRIVIDQDDECVTFYKCSSIINMVHNWEIVIKIDKDVVHRYVVIVISRRTGLIISSIVYKLLTATMGENNVEHLSRDLNNADSDNLGA